MAFIWATAEALALLGRAVSSPLCVGVGRGCSLGIPTAVARAPHLHPGRGVACRAALVLSMND